jgi:hypothetical protein
MTTFQIKLLAAVLMVSDHVGYIFFPDIAVLRDLGRLSFPLFAWLVSQGENFTKNFNIYLLRLTCLGLVSQPLYSLVFEDNSPNILATLALGLLAIRLDKISHLKIVFTFLFAGLAELFKTDYGSYGVLLLSLLSYINLDNLTRLNFTTFTWWMLWSCLNLVLPIWRGSNSSQFLAIFTPLILLNWNGHQGQKAKWFYLFYPIHLALILLIKRSYF